MPTINYGISRVVLTGLLVFSIFRYFYEIDSALSVGSLNLTIYSAFFTFFVMIITKDENDFIRGNFLKIYFVFSIGFIIVHFFSYWSFCLGFIARPVSLGAYSSKIVNESALLSLCCFICYAIGYVSNQRIYEEDDYDSVSEKFELPLSNHILEYIFLISLFLFYAFTDKRYFQTGGNYVITNGEGLSLASSLAQFFVMSAQVACGIQRICRMEYTNIKEYVFSYSCVYYLAAALYGFLVLVSGDRGPLIYMVFGFSVPYFIINGKQFGLKYLFIAIIAGSLSLTFLGILRNVEGDIDVKKIEATNEKLNEGLQQDGAWIFEPTLALSNVVRAYNVVYEFTNENGIVYGLGYLDGFLGFIPGLRTHVIYPLVGVENNNLVNTGYLSTVLLKSDHGMGTSPVGDTYYNFGFFGALLVFLLFGYACKSFDAILFMKTSSLFVYVLAFWVLVYSVYIGRATFFAPVTLSIYTWVLMRAVLFLTSARQ